MPKAHPGLQVKGDQKANKVWGKPVLPQQALNCNRVTWHWSQDKPLSTVVLRCFTTNTDLCTDRNKSLVLLFTTLPLVFIKKGSRKRRFLKSVSNPKIFVLGQSVVCFVVMVCSVKALLYLARDSSMLVACLFLVVSSVYFTNNLYTDDCKLSLGV